MKSFSSRKTFLMKVQIAKIEYLSHLVSFCGVCLSSWQQQPNIHLCAPKDVLKQSAGNQILLPPNLSIGINFLQLSMCRFRLCTDGLWNKRKSRMNYDPLLGSQREIYTRSKFFPKTKLKCWRRALYLRDRKIVCWCFKGQINLPYVLFCPKRMNEISRSRVKER